MTLTKRQLDHITQQLEKVKRERLALLRTRYRVGEYINIKEFIAGIKDGSITLKNPRVNGTYSSRNFSLNFFEGVSKEDPRYEVERIKIEKDYIDTINTLILGDATEALTLLNSFKEKYSTNI